MKTFYTAASLPGFGAVKTYAAHPVWKGSTTGEVKFAPLPKREAVKIFHDVRRFERQTAITRRDAFGKVSTQGRIGRMGILVLHALIFDFLNYKTGRLDPGHQAIAEKAGICKRSVAYGLERLRKAGVLNWVQRCAGRLVDNHFTLEQDTNAYGILPPSQWQGYRPAPEPPPPDPASWGASPPLPGALALAAAAIGAGDRRRAQALMACDPGDLLAAAMARLGRHQSS